MMSRRALLRVIKLLVVIKVEVFTPAVWQWRWYNFNLQILIVRLRLQVFLLVIRVCLRRFLGF